MPNIELRMLPTEERDRTIGAYMDTWSRLEVILEGLVSTLLRIDYEGGRAVFATLGSRQIHDLLNALAKLRLNDTGARMVAGICNRFHGFNTKRNRIVHGVWAMVVTVGHGEPESEWVRKYTPIDPDLASMDHREPKIASNYAFTLPSLRTATSHVETLLNDASELGAKIRQREFDRLPPAT